MARENKKLNIEAGNIYTFPLNEFEYLSLRVILNIEEQCIFPKKAGKYTALPTFFSSCLIEVYKNTTRSATEFDDSVLLIPALLCDIGNRVAKGEFARVGNKPVIPENICFPEFVSSRGAFTAVLIVGELEYEFEMNMQEVEKLDVIFKSFTGLYLKVMALYNLGRADEIGSNFVEVESFDQSHYNMRFSKFKDKVYALVNDYDPTISYHQNALKKGFDVTRFYK